MVLSVKVTNVFSRTHMDETSTSTRTMGYTPASYFRHGLAAPFPAMRRKFAVLPGGNTVLKKNRLAKASFLQR